MELSERVEPVSVIGHARCYKKRPGRLGKEDAAFETRLLPRSGYR